jgi:hypothetical protein
MPSATVDAGAHTDRNPGAKPNADPHPGSDSLSDRGTTGERPAPPAAQF